MTVQIASIGSLHTNDQNTFCKHKIVQWLERTAAYSESDLKKFVEKYTINHLKSMQDYVQFEAQKQLQVLQSQHIMLSENHPTNTHFLSANSAQISLHGARNNVAGIRDQILRCLAKCKEDCKMEMRKSDTAELRLLLKEIQKHLGVVYQLMARLDDGPQSIDEADGVN